MTRYRVQVVGLTLLVACSSPSGSNPAVEPDPSADAKEDVPDMSAPVPRVLVFTRTEGYRHDSIESGVTALAQLGLAHGFTVDDTDDPTRFTAAGLSPYAAVVFLSTTGDVLDDAQQAAFETWFAAGGGYVGIHAAADCEYGWPWYGDLVGAWFDSHPAIQEAQLKVEGGAHPATAGLPGQWVRTDEWYNFRRNPRADVQVLLTLDESSYEGGTMGLDHPIAWAHETSGGRAFYTAGGHTAESFGEPLFRAHLAGGILWAAGLAP